MNLAWVSAPIWAATGYGKVTREFLPKLKYPEQKIVITTGGLSSGPFVEWNGIKVYPGMSSQLAKGDIHIANLEKLLHDTKTDFWVLHNDAWAYRENIKKVGMKYPCVTYSPIDGGHVSVEELEALSVAIERVAMCDYAEREITKHGLSAVNIPHGVNTKIYNPQSKDEWRDIFKLPKDEFIIGFVGTNISKRKGQAELMMALKKVFDTGRKFSIVMITNVNGQASGGYDLWKLAQYIGLPKHLLRFPTDSFSFTEEEMAGWYNAFDIFVNVSRGEGFGIPILESQACSTPVIATDFSSMTELVEGHGILIPPKSLDVYTLKTQYLAIADVDKFADGIIKCIDRPDWVKSMGKRACKFTQKYDWNKLAPRWDRMFKKLEDTGFFPPYAVKEYK